MRGEPRIVEIGPRPYISRWYKNTAEFFSTDWAGHVEPGVAPIRTLRTLWRRLGQTDIDLIVCHPSFSAPWGFRHIARSIFSKRLLWGRSPLMRAYGPEIARLRSRSRLIVVDLEDLPVINPSNLPLLDASHLWFKRELPTDHWRVFNKTAHPNLPTPRFRLDARHRGRIAKLRPISIGLPEQTDGQPPRAAQAKTTDVFFAGRVTGSSTIRARGWSELQALAAEGRIRLDIPEQRLPLAEFYRRCASAWLVWSPEGLGWDCFRHYEAPLCFSTPVINSPLIDRHAPLIAGEHAVYYDPEPGGLSRAVLRALSDKPSLARMAEAARSHLLACHTRDALARHVVDTSLHEASR